MITEGWMNMRGGRFTADISELSDHSKTGKEVNCPGCKTELKLSNFKERKDEDGDVSTWTKKCSCGAEMTIFNEDVAVSIKPTFKQFMEARGDDKMAGDSTHPYSVKITHKGKDKKWPALKGDIYENDVKIGSFSRGAVRDGHISPIVSKFGSSAAKSRFEDFSDSLSIAETIEALLP